MKRFFSVACVTVVCLTTGCTNLTMLRTEELRGIQSRVDSLRAEVARREEKIVKQQDSHTDLLRAIRADMKVKLSEIDKRIGALEANVSESQSRLSQIDRKTREIRDRWEEKAKSDSLMEASQSAEMENLFQIAFADFTAGRYDLALAGFEDLRTRFPESGLAAQSLYWSSECYYVQKMYDEAVAGYIEYIKNYPQEDKICASLYKLGLVYGKQKKSKSRTMVWQKLQAQCPDSEEARAAAAAQ